MEQKKWKILWIDDEMELLRPHIILLKQRDYDVLPQLMVKMLSNWLGISISI